MKEAGKNLPRKEDSIINEMLLVLSLPVVSKSLANGSGLWALSCDYRAKNMGGYVQLSDLLQPGNDLGLCTLQAGIANCDHMKANMIMLLPY